MTASSKESRASKDARKRSEERERELRVETARAQSKSFDDQLAFRRRLRGIFSLLQGGFKGFSSKPLGGRDSIG